MSSRRPPASCKTRKLRCEAAEEDPDYILFLDHLHADPCGPGYFLRLDNLHLRYEHHHNFSTDEDEDAADSDGDETWKVAAALSEIVDDPHHAPSIGPDYLRFLHRAGLHSNPQSLALRLQNNAPASKERNAIQISGCSDLHSSNRHPSPRSSDRRGTRASSSFSIKLAKLLNMPFDQGEYKRLMRLAGKRTPLLKFKHLRTADVPYETGQMGRSYFDHYPELCTKVKRADRVDRLKLLRGFMFWLENVEHEGAYRPWVSTDSNRRTEPSCRHDLLPKATARPNI